jgi:hypothetical protein
MPLQGLFCYHHFPPDVKKIAHIRPLPIGRNYASNWFDLNLKIIDRMAHHVLLTKTAKVI